MLKNRPAFLRLVANPPIMVVRVSSMVPLCYLAAMVILRKLAALIGVALIGVASSATAETSRGIVAANGLQIAYIERGPASAPPILFIQGVGAHIEAGPDLIADSLVAAGFRWIAFDNRDSGGSTRFTEAGPPNYEAIQRAAAEGRPPPLAYTVSDMANDAIGLLDALNIDKAHVVGGSLGGVIAQVLAARHPDRVLSLTLISTTTGNLHLAMGSAVALLALPVPEEREARIDHEMDFERALIGPGQQIDETALRESVVARLDRAEDDAATARQGIAISGDQRMSNATISAPTEVVHGALDPLFPPEHGRDVAASIPGAVLTIVPDMGHVTTDALAQVIVDAILRATSRTDP